MEEVKLELNFANGIFKLYELKHEYIKSLDNMYKLLTQYDTLVDIVEASGRVSELPEDFLNGIKESKTNMQNQIAQLEKRQELLLELLNMHESENTKEVADKAINLVFNILGIVDQEHDKDNADAVTEPTEEVAA